jgi:hypothetical protein
LPVSRAWAASRFRSAFGVPFEQLDHHFTIPWHGSNLERSALMVERAGTAHGKATEPTAYRGRKPVILARAARSGDDLGQPGHDDVSQIAPAAGV